MKKTTIARVIATAASTAGALVCPQLVQNQQVDVAIKAGVATMLSFLPDTIAFGWEKSKEYDVKMAIERQPQHSYEVNVPSAHVERTELHMSTNEGIDVVQHPPQPAAQNQRTQQGRGQGNKA